jgi:hypothetical protein
LGNDRTQKIHSKMHPCLLCQLSIQRVCYRTTTSWMIFLISFSTFFFSSCSRCFWYWNRSI